MLHFGCTFAAKVMRVRQPQKKAEVYGEAHFRVRSRRNWSALPRKKERKRECRDNPKVIKAHLEDIFQEIGKLPDESLKSRADSPSDHWHAIMGRRREGGTRSDIGGAKFFKHDLEMPRLAD